MLPLHIVDSYSFRDFVETCASGKNQCREGHLPDVLKKGVQRSVV